MNAFEPGSSEVSWVPVGSCDEVPPREGRLVHVRGRSLAIFNLGTVFTALDNRCPHKGGPLSDGIVAGAVVVCPLHAWKVNANTGAVERPCESGLRVKTYPTRIERGRLYVAVPSVPIAAPEVRTA